MSATIPESQLLPGDLLLHSSKGEVSKLIMWASDSDYSHIAMVFEPGRLAEARSAGVLFAERLADRVKAIGTHFHRIDAVRLQKPDPIPPAVLNALQDGARTMTGSKFALNDLFQLGVIAAMRNKLPGDALGQWLLTAILDHIVPQDPKRLVCSEFIYLAFHRARTVPPGLIDPVLVKVDHPNRPWPTDLDWIALWKEYRDASHSGGAAIEAMPYESSPLYALQQQVTDDEATRDACLAAMARTRLQIASRLADTWAIDSPKAAMKNPDLTVPQDFLDSPSFRLLGSVVP